MRNAVVRKKLLTQQRLWMKYIAMPQRIILGVPSGIVDWSSLSNTPTIIV